MKAFTVFALHAKPKHAVYPVIALLLSLPGVTPAQVVAKNDAGGIADAAADTTTATTQPTEKNNPANPDSIVTFEQLDMPIEMEIELSRLGPKGMLLYHSEFQGMHDGLYGQALRTLKIWYIDDHFIGYVIDNPIDAGARMVKKRINIPVTWCCTPTIVGHSPHCAQTITDLRDIETGNKCTGWHLKLPPPIEFQAPVKLQKIKKSRTATPKDSTTAAFGHAEKTTTKPTRKKRDKQQGFELAVTDSTGVKQE